MQLGEWPLPEYFEDETAILMCSIIRDTSAKVGLPISYGILKDAITKYAKKKPETGKHLVRMYRKMRDPISQIDRKYTEQEIKEVSKKKAIEKALVKAIDLWREDRVFEIEDVIAKALSVGKGITHLGTNPFRDAATILSREEDTFRPIRTLIHDLDAHLPHGGICIGDLAVVLSLSGVGKTMFLISCAKAAVIQNKRAVYYTLEMSEADIAERFISSFSSVKLKQLYEHKSVVSTRMQNLGYMYENCLLIKEFPSQTASIKTFDAHLRMVYAQLEYRPDMVIVDYAGEMAGVVPVRKHGSSERYLELGSIFSELTSMGQERKISVWTGAQVNRSKTARELITIEDIAESFRGVFTASTVVSLNQTPVELENQKMRLFLAKNRKGISKKIINVSTNFEMGSFWRRTSDSSSDWD